MDVVSYATVRVRVEEPICFLQLHRPERNNTINAALIAECREVLAGCGESITIVVVEGGPEVFCFGADFQGVREAMSPDPDASDPAALYDLWETLATGPYISIAHVRGKANAGGVGFAAACDIVIASETAQFSLSELLFGLFPACVLPFLIRRTGFQRAHYLTLMTQPIPVQQAHAWGLVDAYDANSELVLRRHLGRLRRLTKPSIRGYKRYVTGLTDSIGPHRAAALTANRQLFSDRGNLEGIRRYVETGLLPWER